ncbi:MAG: DUF6498-containing protein [Casimicrobiaceae bacterium]
MRLSPLEIGNLVLRNIVPIAGLVFFHWSAANLLILYFIDTLLAFAVIVAGFLYSQFPDEEAEGLAARLNTIVGYAAGALFLALLFAVPHRYTPEALGLKRRFAFVMLRWVGTMIVAYVPLTFLLGRFGPLLLVVVYIALTIFAELMPDRFLAAFGEIGRDVASDAPGARTAKGLPQSPGAHARARRRHPLRKH